jgi:hypothetical protein
MGEPVRSLVARACGWAHEPAAAADLQAAMAWSANHPAADADLEDTMTRFGRDEA